MAPSNGAKKDGNDGQFGFEAELFLAGLRDLLLPKLMFGEIRAKDAEMAAEEAA